MLTISRRQHAGSDHGPIRRKLPAIILMVPNIAILSKPELPQQPGRYAPNLEVVTYPKAEQPVLTKGPRIDEGDELILTVTIGIL